MLVRFNVKNFLSFGTTEKGRSEEFSMIAGKADGKSDHVYKEGDNRLLRFAAVYGANAAGKSNLVKAIGFMRETVVNGLPDGHTDKYCRSSPENQEKPSYFEIEMLLDGKNYSYGFEVVLSQSKYVSEWLLELGSDDNDKVLFERIDSATYHWGILAEYDGLGDKLEAYAADIDDPSGTLFLSYINHDKKKLYQDYESAGALQDVYSWIRDSLDVNFPDRPKLEYSYYNLMQDSKRFAELMSAFDTGIRELDVVDLTYEKFLSILPEKVGNEIAASIEKMQAELDKNDKNKGGTFVLRSRTELYLIKMERGEKVQCQTIGFLHNNCDGLFKLPEESDGTIRLLDILEMLLSNRHKTYVVDELDRCLHPSLTYKLVEIFLDFAKSRDVQLIVTTHESRLMDFDLLRRDEIWFINKRSTGESDIYSLDEYNTRFDNVIEDAYLDGRYGGVPVFNSVFPVLGDGL